VALLLGAAEARSQARLGSVITTCGILTFDVVMMKLLLTEAAGIAYALVGCLAVQARNIEISLQLLAV